MANILGLRTVNSKQIIEVDGDPSAGGGTPAPRGSMALYDTGSVGYVYVKSGTADTAWSSLDLDEGHDWEIDGNTLTGATFDAPTQWFGSNNDYDVVYKRNNVELMRLVSQGLLVGLNASLGGRLQVGVASLGDELFRQSSPNGGSGARVAMVTVQHKVQTTDATATTLFDLSIPTDSVMYAKTHIVARQHSGSSGSAGDGAVYVRENHVRNVAGTCTRRGYEDSFTSEDSGGFNASFSISTTNLRCQVEGGTNRNMAWSAHTEFMIAID